jgi:hypothetical protein
MVGRYPRVLLGPEKKVRIQGRPREPPLFIRKILRHAPYGHRQRERVHVHPVRLGAREKQERAETLTGIGSLADGVKRTPKGIRIPVAALKGRGALMDRAFQRIPTIPQIGGEP